MYVCNDNLRKYLAQYIKILSSQTNDEVSYIITDVSNENSILFYDLTVAAGCFSELQQFDQVSYIQIDGVTLDPSRYFACKIVGESMNEIIPNGSICLFEKYQSGSRNGMICLVESTSFIDIDFGSNYTIKEYSSKKTISDEGGSIKKSRFYLSPLIHPIKLLY